MSANHHTAFAPNYALTKSAWNAPLSQLDTVITNAQAGTQVYTGLQLEGGTLGASALTGTNATDKGHRLPAMTTTQRDAIASPATGLMVFNVTTGLINVYNGSSWEGAASSLQYVLLDEGESSDVASVAISSIDQSYQDLILVGHARSRDTSQDNLRVRFNGDSTADAYETAGKWWNSNVENAFSDAVGATSLDMNFIPDANDDTGVYSNFVLTIPFYARVGLELGGWFYSSYKDTSSSAMIRNFAGWVYRHASSTAVASITLLSENAANIDMKWRLYGRGN